MKIEINANNSISNTKPPFFFVISGSKQRSFAFAIDMLILSILGLLLGLIFSKWLYELGPYATPLGFILFFPYFSIFNSKIGNGQTIGKRIMNIAVRDRNNEPVSLFRSSLRTLIIGLPIFFYNYSGLTVQNSLINRFLFIILISIGITSVYLLWFNRETRQVSHDLLMGTYVVNKKKKTKVQYTKTEHRHLIISGILVGIVTITAFNMPFSQSSHKSSILESYIEPLDELIHNNQEILTSDMRVRTNYSNGEKSSKVLMVKVWLKGKHDQNEIIALLPYYAKMIIKNNQYIDQYDKLSIIISTGFDIGIAFYKKDYGWEDTISGWQEKN